MKLPFGWTRKAAFQYPVGTAPKTAVLVNWFRNRSSVRAFPGWSDAARQFAPAAIAGTRDQLLALAAHPPELTHAVIVLSRPSEPVLTPDDRDQLWRAFGVPVFAQVIAMNGDRVAYECEAHDALHSEAPAPEGFALEDSICACGSKVPRLVVAVPAMAERARTATMSMR